MPSEVEDCEAACKRSLAKLKVEYLDLYLVHWPIATKLVKKGEDGEPDVYEKINIPNFKVWAQMEALVEKGLVKSIGVSNWNV